MELTDRIVKWAPLICLTLIFDVVRRIHTWFNRMQHHRRISAQNGCALPPKLQVGQLPDLGVRKLKQSAQHIQHGTYLELSKNRFDQVGASTYMSTNLGSTMIDTCDPRNIQTMLATRFEDWSLGEQRHYAFSPLLGQGIFAADGATWKHSRKLLRPNFSSETLSDPAVFEQHVQHLFQAIDDAAGGPIDLSDLFFRLTLDTATELFFGQSCESLKDSMNTDSASKSAREFSDAFNRTQRKLADDLVLGRLSPFLTSRQRANQYQKDCRTVHDFVADTIKTQQQAFYEQGLCEQGRYVLLHELLKSGQDLDIIRNELVNILVAGRDTTASLLSNLWFTLIRSPQIYETLRNEIACSVGCGQNAIEPTLEHLQSLPFLRACIDEALRLFPPVPVNSRTAVNDTLLPRGGGSQGGQPLFVPKGTRVGYNIWALHRRDDIWGPDAAVFRPERWLEKEANSHRTAWHFLPFNGGPRVCLGRQLALAQARYVTCRLVQSFTTLEAAAENHKIDTTTTDRVDSNGASFASHTPSGPACSWQWQEALTLTVSSRAGTFVQVNR